jgi:hypothetical protein
MDNDGCSPGYEERLARAEKQLAELQAEVAELKRILGQSDIGHAGELHDGVCDGSVAASAPTSGSGGLVMDPACAEVRLTILAVAAPQADPYRAQGSVLEDPADAGTWTHLDPVVFVQAPRELQDWASRHPELLSGHAKSMLETMREQFSQSAASWLVDSAWEPAAAAWRVTDFADFDILSGLSEAVGNWEHQEAGAFAEQLGRITGLSGIAVDGAGVVVRYLVPLPGDQALEDFSRLIKVAGIVAFGLAGGHVLACASLKSLVHDELIDLVANGISSVISPRVDEPGSTPGSTDSLESSAIREREVTRNILRESIRPDSYIPAAPFSFSEIELPPTESLMTLYHISGIPGELAAPGSQIFLTSYLPEGKYPDDTPEIKI